MVKIRLQRRGRKKLPIYKIVASDSRTPRDGRFIEALGQYTPLSTGGQVTLDQDRVLYWLGVGAQPTDTVKSLLSGQGIMLRVHLARKGKSQDDIEKEVAVWLQARADRATSKMSKKQLRAARKQAETAAAEPAAAPEAAEA